MRRKARELFIARARVEPDDFDGLEALFQFMLDKRPDNLRVLPPEDHHTAAYLYSQPFKAKSASRANSLAEYMFRKKMINPAGVSIKRLSVEAMRVVEGQKWPEDWFTAESVDRLGSDPNEVIELRKKGKP